ncbi:MAG: GNAT family N-acetyltransferase [Acidimicrobiia bacterium]|nr:GNAT family N-acetyltransferase [Acidimicrobiia bacterium]
MSQSPAPATVELGGGHLLRAATPDDIDDIVTLEVAAFGASDEPRLRAHLNAPATDTQPAGVDDWTVVCQRGRVVSACGLLHHRLWVDGAVVPAGQIEWVATAPGHRRGGLVRAQFSWLHRRATEHGMVVLLVAGIPYLYRRFGYGYGLSWPGTWHLADDSHRRLAHRGQVRIRPAEPRDVAALVSADAHRHQRQVRIERSSDTWARLVSYCRPGGAERLAVAEDRQGDLVGWVKSEHADVERQVWALPSYAATTDVGRALVAHVAAERPPEWSLHLAGGPGAWGATLRATARSTRYDHGIFVRCPDPHALARALVPVWNRRLANSDHHESGELDISLYRTTVRLHLDEGKVTEVGHGPIIEDPFDHADVGVAPDWFGALCFGRWGAQGLAERCDDVTLGRYPGLMGTLFPRLDSDVVCDL